MTLQAVVFDLGNTLLDNRPLFRHRRELMARWPMCVVQTLADAGYALETESVAQALVSTMRRMAPRWGDQRSTNVVQVFEAAWKELGLGVSEEDARACLKAYYRLLDPYTLVDADARSILALLRRRGLKLGSVCNTIWEGRAIDRQLAQMGLIQYLPVRIYSSEVGMVKPEAGIFQRALGELGVPAAQAVFVGDNPRADVFGAQGAGMKAIWRQYAPEQPPPPGEIVPDGHIRALVELPAQLDRLFPGWASES